MTTQPPARQRVPVSVIIPLAPGETEAAGLLTELQGVPADWEILVVCPGDPPPVRTGIRIVVSPAGRARQMNAGAAAANGRWLWFLHADSRLTPGCLAALAAFVSADVPALGWFSLAFRQDGPALTRLNAAGANWRSRWLGLPFGDQGLTLPAEQFAALGGFDETAVRGEDHLLVWAAHAARLPLRRIDAALVTSARRYARHGWLRTTGAHWRGTLAQAYTGWRRMRLARRGA